MKRKTTYLIIAMAVLTVWSMNHAQGISAYTDNTAATLAAIGE